jgi:hypothetical protein
MGQRKHKIKGSQAKARLHALFIDGSAVTTTASATGLDQGSADFTVVKGSGGTSNEVTLTPKEAFKRAPIVVASSLTTNCHVEVKSRSATSIVLETFQVADGTTGVDDADLNVIIWGSDSASEQ